MNIPELVALLAIVGPQYKGLNTAYLFGSRARCKPNPKDFDIAILADERIAKTQQQIWDLGGALHDALHEHVRPLDLVTLNGTNSMLIQEVLIARCVLFCSDKTYRVRWEAYERQRAWDDGILLAGFRKRLKARVGIGDDDTDGTQAGGESS